MVNKKKSISKAHSFEAELCYGGIRFRKGNETSLGIFALKEDTAKDLLASIKAKKVRVV